MLGPTPIPTWEFIQEPPYCRRLLPPSAWIIVCGRLKRAREGIGRGGKPSVVRCVWSTGVHVLTFLLLGSDTELGCCCCLARLVFIFLRAAASMTRLQSFGTLGCCCSTKSYWIGTPPHRVDNENTDVGSPNAVQPQH